MQLQIDVNTIKSDIFLELLNLFKKDNMINDYRIIDKKVDTDEDILNDLSQIKDTLKSAKNSKGYDTFKTINIKDM